jgi:formyl-CoA transferase
MLFQSTGYLTLGAMDVPLPRLGNEFRIATPANVYRCRDGHLMAGVLLDAHWARLAAALGRPELGEDPGYATTPARLERREEVDALLAGWAAERSLDEALRELREAGVPAAPVQSYAQAARDPHVIEREMLQPVLQGGREVPLASPPVRFSRTPTRIRHGAAPLGEHTSQILRELGLDDDEVRRLREAGAIA